MPARVTIDQLPVDDAVSGTELLVLQDGATTKSVAVSVLTTPTQQSIDAHISDVAEAHAASAISASPSGGTMTGSDVQAQLAQAATAVGTTQTNLDTHVNSATGAHAGTAISATPTGSLTATTVEGQLDQIAGTLTTLDTDVDAATTTATGAQSSIDAHLADTIDAHDALAISATPQTNYLTSNNVQDQLSQVESQLAVLVAPAAVGVSCVPSSGATATNVQQALDAIWAYMAAHP